MGTSKNKLANALSRLAWPVRMVGFLLLLTHLGACKKEMQAKAPTTDSHSAGLRITALHVYDSFSFMDSALEGVQLRIFESRRDMLFNDNHHFERFSDSMGFAEISGISFDKVYVRGFLAGFPVVEDSVTTPTGTVSFLDLLFPPF